MRFRDLPKPIIGEWRAAKSEVVAFATLKEADVVANALREMLPNNPGYDVLTFAAGNYYVLLISPNTVEDTDVENTNP